MQFNFAKIFCVLALLAPTISGAEDAASTSTVSPNSQPPASSSTRDGVEVSLQLSDSSVIPLALSGMAMVKNNNSHLKVTVTALRITPYGIIGGIYKPFEGDTTPQIEIGALTARPFPVNFETARAPSLFEHAAFRSGPNEFTATLTYFVDGQATGKSVDFIVNPRVTTASYYVYIGGLCGAILLISFILASKVLNAARIGQLASIFPHAKPLAAKWALLAIAYAVNGFVVALLLVLLSTGLTTFQIPISFKLQDFSGGLIVGLFSVTLGKFLAEKLSLTP